MANDYKKRIVREFKVRDQEASSHARDFLREAKTDYAFYANDQWTEEDRKLLDMEHRPYTTLNQIRPVIDVVVGSDITNRFDIKYLARTPGDIRERVSRMMTETARYIREKTRAGHHESKAFWDMVVCGLGCIEIYQDYERDPDGLTMIKRVSPFDVRVDPFAREQNLRDKRYVIRRAWISANDFKFMWPAKYKKVSQSNDRGDGEASMSLGVQRIAGYSARDAGFYDKNRDEYLVNDYEYFERKKMWRIQDPISGEIFEAMDEQKKDEEIQKILEGALINRFPLGDDFEDSFVSELPRREYYRAYICGEEILSIDKIKTGDFTYHFLTGFEDHRENKTSWLGLVRYMREPQKWANKFFSQLIYIMATNPKGGYWYEDGAFDDEQEAKRLIPQPNTAIKLAPGGMDKIKERDKLSFPTGLEHMIRFASENIPNTSGVNYFLQGTQQGDQPGVVVEKYQQQGMIILSVLFDSLSHYREDIGDSQLAFIREYMPDNHIVRINTELGDEAVVQYSKEWTTHKFDIVVSQSPTSPNMQKEFWEMMVQTNFIGQLMEMGFPVPSSIFNYLPMPDQFRRDWVKEIEMQKMMQQQMAAQGQPLPQEVTQ